MSINDKKKFKKGRKPVGWKRPVDKEDGFKSSIHKAEYNIDTVGPRFSLPEEAEKSSLKEASQAQLAELLATVPVQKRKRGSAVVLNQIGAKQSNTYEITGDGT